MISVWGDRYVYSDLNITQGTHVLKHIVPH
jgi:hypothetical protein